MNAITSEHAITYKNIHVFIHVIRICMLDELFNCLSSNCSDVRSSIDLVNLMICNKELKGIVMLKFAKTLEFSLDWIYESKMKKWYLSEAEFNMIQRIS